MDRDASLPVWNYGLNFQILSNNCGVLCKFFPLFFSNFIICPKIVKKLCSIFAYHKSHLNGSRRVVAGLTLRPKFANFVQILSSILPSKWMKIYFLSHKKFTKWIINSRRLRPKCPYFVQISSKFCSNFAKKLLSMFAFQIINEITSKWIKMCCCRSDTMNTKSKFGPYFV